MSQPTLPEEWRVDSDGEIHYTPACMQAYGQQCREAALEDAANWLDWYDGKVNSRRAEYIRSLK